MRSADRAALERLVDQAAQTAMLRIVVADHVERQETDRPGEEPQYSLLCSAPGVGGVACEVLMILQQCCAAVMGDGEPCAADNRQLHANNRTFGSHAVKCGQWICVKSR